MARTRILVIDDHAGMRDGICAMVNARPDMVVVAVASEGRDAIEQFRTVLPDVSILDWNLPVVSGAEVIATLIKEFPQARFIVITALSDDLCAQRAIDLGAKAYIHKHMLRRELIPAIGAVHQGQQYFPEKNSNPPKKDY